MSTDERVKRKYYTQRAVDRAWERYGLALKPDDMAEILRACNDGRASRMHTSEEGVLFIWTYKRQLIVPALSPELDCIRTFVPADRFSARKRRHHFMAGRRKLAATKMADRDRYNRAKENRLVRGEDCDGMKPRALDLFCGAGGGFNGSL